LTQQLQALFLQFDLFGQRLVGIVDGALGVAVAAGIERAARAAAAPAATSSGSATPSTRPP
jgi:hypothetical protein